MNARPTRVGGLVLEGDGINILVSVSERGPHATAMAIPDFPLVRFHTGMVAYEEALIDGQYFAVNWSPMGRPSSREQIWEAYSGGASSWRPLRAWQHAFLLQVDGQRLTDRWQWIGATEETTPQGRKLVVELQHQLRPVNLKLHTELDDTAFFRRWLEITNCGDRPAAIAEVFPWSGTVWTLGQFKDGPLPAAGAFSLGWFQNREALAEGQFEWKHLPLGGLRIQNLRGRSGHGCPFFMLRNEVGGQLVLGHLEYSGNWQMEFHVDQEPVLLKPPPQENNLNRRPSVGLMQRTTAWLYARLGMAGPAPLRVLDPGETVRTPAVHLGQVYGDLDTGVQELHTHLRRSVTPPQRQRPEHPVTCNHTGYTVNAQVSEEQLIEDVDLAADVGAELFIVDAGWFGDQSSRWGRLVGDWEESPLLPGGLTPVFDRAREHGMLCGLWVEIERAGADSKLRAAHPDWLMTRRGEVFEQSLDLAKPEVAQFVETTIVGLIERHRLDCFRLDYNWGVGEGAEVEHAGFAESTMWRYYDALYDIFDRIRERFPDLILENCSGGGGRMDLGMLRRFHWTQVSDNWSPAATLKIMNGMSLALPPEQCMTLLGAISDGTADLDFMLRIGLFGHFCISGIAPSMRDRQPRARERWRHAIELYKTFVRPLLSTCRVYHHTPLQRHSEPGDWCVLEHATPDASRAYAGVFKLAGARADRYHLRPRGLDPSRRYRVTFDNRGHTIEIDGWQLVDRGLQVYVPGAHQSELVLFEAV